MRTHTTEIEPMQLTRSNIEHKQVIDKIRRDNSTAAKSMLESMANALDIISSDLYSENQRFIYELIQNADDAALGGRNEITFDFFPEYIIMAHNGQAFNESDVEALNSVGRGTKGGDQKKTGYKGIGFKSVFGKSAKVAIFSNGYHFRFDKEEVKKQYSGNNMPWQMMPLWCNEEYLERIQAYMEYSVVIYIERGRTDDILSDIMKLLLDGNILLFLRSIKQITVREKGTLVNTLTKKTSKIAHNLDAVDLERNGELISSWLLSLFCGIKINREISDLIREDSKSPEKLKLATETEISFAARISKGHIKGLSGDESKIYTYLPTNISSYQLPFLFNANFLTTANREDLHQDSEWNQWLFRIMGYKLFEWLSIITSTKYRANLFELIPDLPEIHNTLAKSLSQSISENVGSQKFIPTRAGLKSLREVIYDNTGLTETPFLSDKRLAEYLSSVKGQDFDSTAIVDKDIVLTAGIRKLGIRVFDHKDVPELFYSKEFQEGHTFKLNVDLIEYVYLQVNSGKQKQKWFDIISRLPFLLSKGQGLLPPVAICFPSHDYKNEFGESVTVINGHVYNAIDKNPVLRNWLESLGVKEPSDIAYIENEVIGRIDDAVTDTNYIQVTRFLYNQSRKGFLDSSHYEALKKLKLKTVDGGFIQAQYCYMHSDYRPRLNLMEYTDKINFTDNGYIRAGDIIGDWNSFLHRIGVGEDLEFEEYYRISRDSMEDVPLDADFLRENGGCEYERWLYASGTKYFPYHHFSFSRIRYVELTTDYGFSKLFWGDIIKKIEPSRLNTDFRGFWGGYGMPGSTQGERADFSYMGWILSNKAVIPTTLNNTMLAADVFVNSEAVKEIAGNYLPVLQVECIPNKEWTAFLGLKTELSLDDCLLVLEKIAEKGIKEGAVSKGDKHMVGRIYTRLAKHLSGEGQDVEERVKAWAKENKLLSFSGAFMDPAELFFISRQEFNETTHLNTIYLPFGSDSDRNDFIGLMKALGVSVVDEFVSEIEGAFEDASLIVKLRAVVPYFAYFVASKEMKDGPSLFKTTSAAIDKLVGFQADSIALRPKAGDELLEGIELDWYSTGNKVYYHGSWTSDIILYDLVPYLLELFELRGYKTELTLMLRSGEEQLCSWLAKKGIDVPGIESSEEYLLTQEILEKLGPVEEHGEVPDVDHSDERSRLTISLEAKQIILEKLKAAGFDVPEDLSIRYTIVKGVSSPAGRETILVIKSAKGGTIFFNPSEWIALASGAQLYVLSYGNVVRNVTIDELIGANEVFFMRFNSEAFAVKTNLALFAQFFRYHKFSHFLFHVPESEAGFDKDFGLSLRNPSAGTLTSDDIKLLD